MTNNPGAPCPPSGALEVVELGASRAGSDRALVEAGRDLLWADTEEDVQGAADRLVRRLGGRLVPAADPQAHQALPIDLAFAGGPPLLALAPPASVARMLLERDLPAFAEDAKRAVSLLSQRGRLTQDATADPLTGLANRRILNRLLARVHPGDVVVMFDLDFFKLAIKPQPALLWVSSSMSCWACAATSRISAIRARTCRSLPIHSL